jgi:hypothetical protein
MRKSLRLILLASIAYAASVYLTRGFLPNSIPTTLTFLVFPLGLLAIVFYLDLRFRARVPSAIQLHEKQSTRSLGHEVQLLTKRIEVATNSSVDYYEKVILGRMRELMVERASIETGAAVEDVRKILGDPQHARRFLGNDSLYNLLYTRRSSRGRDRREMLARLTDLIEDWKA